MTGHFEGDVLLLDHTPLLPPKNKAFHTQFFFIGLCIKGKLKSEYDYQPLDFQEGEIGWILPGHQLKHNYASDDYTVVSIFFSPSLYEYLKQSGVLGKYYYMFVLNSIHLDPHYFKIVYDAFLLMNEVSKTNLERRKDVIASLMMTISTIVDENIEKYNPDVILRNSAHSKMFETFYDLIKVHYRESREVSYYARFFHLTPKYFSTVIKQTTGMSPIEWINGYMIIEAKKMLTAERGKSIQQIAYGLGFSNQASFCRFFKQMEGISPKYFREKI